MSAEDNRAVEIEATTALDREHQTEGRVHRGCDQTTLGWATGGIFATHAASNSEQNRKPNIPKNAVSIEVDCRFLRPGL